MTLRPLLLSAVIGLACAAALHTPAAAAQARGYVSINIGHPPPRYEHYAHRPGYAWVPGRWVSTGYRHVWQPGHYVRVQPAYYGGGYRHLPPRPGIRQVGRPYRPVYAPARPGQRVVYRQPGWGW